MGQARQHLKKKTRQHRLGDYLIEHGEISPDQLDEAIEYQCIYGGKLGTSLIELGLIGEERLARILSKLLRLHYIKPELLMKVPGDILKLVPKQLAIKNQVVPYYREKNKLYVAIGNINNLAAIDELSFQLNLHIVPLAMPEVRLMLALQKHYGMELSPRFEALAAQIKFRNKAAAKIKPKTEEPAPDLAGSENAWPLLGDEEIGPAPDDTSDFTYDRYQEEIGAAAPEDNFAQRLVKATDRNDIARALIDHLGPQYQGCALLMVKATTATGWLCKANNVEQKDFDRLQIPLLEPSIFSQVVKNKTHLLGMVNDTPNNRRLLVHFTSNPPQTALIIPLLVKERLVSLLYIQDGIEKLERHFGDLQNLARKTEMAFAMLILRNKILNT